MLVTNVSVVPIFGSISVRVRLNSAGVQPGTPPKVFWKVSIMSWNLFESSSDRTPLNCEWKKGKEVVSSWVKKLKSTQGKIMADSGMVLVVKIVKKNHGGLRNSFGNKNRPKGKRWEFDEVVVAVEKK